jgi:glycosyltransferase involved in cell wall biosynthesis
MSVHNGERYLREAVDSILAQTYSDFEFIIIDDASTDGTAAILDGYDDARIVRVRNAENLGLTRSLNLGLEMARGEYVARMDADDVSEPTRLDEQVAYLGTHPDVAVLGSWCRLIDPGGQVVTESRYAEDRPVIEWRMCFGCAVTHPSVMMRRSSIVAVGGYDPDYRYAQDYELWTRCIRNGIAVSVLGRFLLRYRLSAEGIGRAHFEQQTLFCLRVARAYVEWYTSRPVTDADVASLWACDARAYPFLSTDAWRASRLAKRLSRALKARIVSHLRSSLHRDLINDVRHSITLAYRNGTVGALEAICCVLYLAPLSLFTGRTISGIVRHVAARVKSRWQTRVAG